MEEELYINDLIGFLWKKKIWIILIALVGALLGFCYAMFLLKPEYSSSFTLKFDRNVTILPDNDEQVAIGDAITQGTALYEYEVYKNQNLISVYGEILKSRTIHEKIIKEFKLEDEIKSYKDFLENLTISYNQNNGIIKVTFKYKDAKIANDIATKLYEVSKKEFEDMYGMQEIYTISEPNVDTMPTKSSKAMFLVLFGVGFGVIAIVGFYIVFFLDNSIRRTITIISTTNYPVLATISKYNKKSNPSGVIALNDTTSVISENYRVLRTGIEKLLSKNSHKVVLVTSSHEGEGVTTCASNLAVVCAMQGKKTVLVDANLRSGEIATLFDVDNKIGLSEYLAKDIDEAKIVTGTKQDKLSVIVAGETPDNPSELLSSDKMTKLIEKLKGEYDLVIVDGSPLLDITDGLILAGISEEVLVVTSYSETKKDDLELAKNALSNVEANNVSAVFNKFVK